MPLCFGQIVYLIYVCFQCANNFYQSSLGNVFGIFELIIVAVNVVLNISIVAYDFLLQFLRAKDFCWVNNSPVITELNRG